MMIFGCLSREGDVMNNERTFFKLVFLLIIALPTYECDSCSQDSERAPTET